MNNETVEQEEVGQQPLIDPDDPCNREGSWTIFATFSSSTTFVCKIDKIRRKTRNEPSLMIRVIAQTKASLHSRKNRSSRISYQLWMEYFVLASPNHRFSVHHLGILRDV